MPSFSPALHSALSEVLKRRLGQGGPWPREVYRHVERQARARGEQPEEWIKGIERRPADLAELLSAATVGHTSFFRHPDHFDQLREFANAVAKRTDCVRVWSAGCSTGEEVWSLALCLKEVGAHFQIWATDVNPKAVELARTGIYPARATAGLPGHAGKLPWKAPTELRDHVRFAVAALSDPSPADAPSAYDVIFCRNVMIYFQPEVVQSTWKMMVQRLAPWGAIVVSPVESLSHVPTELARRGPLGWMEWRTQRSGTVASAPQPLEAPQTAVEHTAASQVDGSLERVARLLSIGAFDAAEEALHRLLALRDDAVGWFLLGEACARRGEITQARVAYLRAARATEVPPDVDLETMRAAGRRRAQQL